MSVSSRTVIVLFAVTALVAALSLYLLRGDGMPVGSSGAEPVPLVPAAPALQASVSKPSMPLGLPAASGPVASRRAPQAQMELSGPVSWANATVESRLTDLLNAAMQSPRADDRRNAGWLAAICNSVHASPPEFARQRIETRYLEGGAPAAVVADAISTGQRAKQDLERFCIDSESPEASEMLKSVSARARSESSATRTISDVTYRGTIAQITEEQRQQIILALSSPAQFPLLTDRYLESMYSTRWQALGGFEAAIARSLAYQELTGDVNPASIRNLFLCVNNGICVRYPADDTFPRAAATARQIVNLVLTQQWATLGLR